MTDDSNRTPSSAGLTDTAADARAAFLDAVATLRPRLHRFCTRMSGSVFDGEDLVQETLADAFFKLGGLRDERLLEPWLFRIAHRKSIDFARRAARDPLDAAVQEPDMEHEPAAGDPVAAAHDLSLGMNAALAAAITQLPPKERACLILKDVLGHGLEEIAAIADTTVGGAKSALHRARTRLAAQERPTTAAAADDDHALLAAYVACFNARDWEAAAELLGADARLELVGRIDARGAEFIRSRYFGNYAAIDWPWRFELWDIDGETVAMMLRLHGDDWRPHAGFRVRWDGGHIVEIRDYIYVPYLYDAALTRRRLD